MQGGGVKGRIVNRLRITFEVSEAWFRTEQLAK